MDALQIYLNEVERQLDKKVKVIRSNRDSEHYGRYNETRQRPGPFAKLLQKRGICAQYTMLRTPQQNVVSERCNRTLMDMVRNMLNNSNLPVSLWMYALKAVMYLLNRVPSKAIPKTPFELSLNRTSSIRHLHVWDCPTEIRVYNSQEKKLDGRTINGYFIGYPKNSKEYMFHYTNHGMRIIEIGNAMFIENGEISGSIVPQDVKIKEVRVQVPLACASSGKVIALLVVPNNNEEKQQNNKPVIHNEPIVEEP